MVARVDGGGKAHYLQPVTKTSMSFKAKLLRPAAADAGWAFVVLPRAVSERLPRRGRTTIDGTVNGHAFRATLEPDGNLSHWLRLDDAFIEAAGIDAQAPLVFEIAPVAQEPEPVVPPDLAAALAAAPEAEAVWNDTTTLARVDWIHWIESAKQAKTRAKRVGDAIDKLSSGERRVCCFDPSGYYSKALSAPR